MKKTTPWLKSKLPTKAILAGNKNIDRLQMNNTFSFSYPYYHKYMLMLINSSCSDSGKNVNWILLFLETAIPEEKWTVRL